MKTCPICDYHYSPVRDHCPTCGTYIVIFQGTCHTYDYTQGMIMPISMAIGAERARQLPQSPSFFQLVD